jgi:GAF domain-containing protein
MMATAMMGRSRSISTSSMELARQRDLNKYYQPWLESSNPNSIPPDTGPRSPQSTFSSHDTTLTALAQLAALRLNAKRAMVSLIDTHTQIILAEATQTISLVDGTRHAAGDHLWLGNVSLPRRDCMDEHVLGAKTPCTDSQGHLIELPALVVNDTLEDERFRSRHYVSSGRGPSVRFYAGVPIFTKHGSAIGAYAVSDTHPRPQGLTLDEIQFLLDASQIVAEHLDRTGKYPPLTGEDTDCD